jgi:hypothetical protein
VSADTIILGAGPAGLGAALALGERAILLERENAVAGLCRTVVLDGVYFDLGGHSFHTPHPGVRKLVFDSVAMEEQQREAWCWIGGAWVPYPFQKHFGALTDRSLREACAAGLAAAGDWHSAPDYDTYLTRRFGAAIVEQFMRPYNRKLWGGDLRRMTADWTGERVAAPEGAEERFVEQGGRRTPLQSDTTVAYPARGAGDACCRCAAWPDGAPHRSRSAATRDGCGGHCALAQDRFDAAAAAPAETAAGYARRDTGCVRCIGSPADNRGHGRAGGPGRDDTPTRLLPRSGNARS